MIYFPFDKLKLLLSVKLISLEGIDTIILACILEEEEKGRKNIPPYTSFRETTATKYRVRVSGGSRQKNGGYAWLREGESGRSPGYLDQNLDRIGCGGSHALRRANLEDEGGGIRWWKAVVDERGAGGGSGEGLKELHRSRVFERARPTPSCSCLPPTACNFLAKALMRGLARDGRSPRTSRREKERKREKEARGPRLSLRSLAHSILFSPSPDSLLFSSLFFSLPLLSFLSSLIHLSSLSLSLSSKGKVSTEVAFTSRVRLEVVLPCT